MKGVIKLTKYDFETGVNRLSQGSTKWKQMVNEKPDVSADTFPLSVADLDIKHPPQLIEGLKSYLDDMILGYTIPTDSFYYSLVHWMESRHNWSISKDWVVHTAGVISAIYQVIDAFTDKGDGVIIMPPVYYPFTTSIENSGRTVVKNPLVEEGGEYSINFAEFEERAKENSNKLLIFCSPHNPIGRVWTKEELNKVLDICIENNVLILSDEIHFDLVMPGNEHTVLADLNGEAKNHVITATAPSKTFNVAGLQMSNIIIPNEEIRNQLQQNMDTSGIHGPNAIGPKANEILYNEAGDWLDEFIELIYSNHQFLKEFFAEHLPKLHVYDLQGTFLQWIDFRPLDLDKEELESFLKEDCELFLDEGYIFGQEGAGFERINIGCPRHILEEAMNRLVEGIKNKGIQ